MPHPIMHLRDSAAETGGMRLVLQRVAYCDRILNIAALTPPLSALTVTRKVLGVDGGGFIKKRVIKYIEAEVVMNRLVLKFKKRVTFKGLCVCVRACGGSSPYNKQPQPYTLTVDQKEQTFCLPFIVQAPHYRILYILLSTNMVTSCSLVPKQNNNVTTLIRRRTRGFNHQSTKQ